MPLPSVEAATREAAVAAARQQYGPSVRIVGVRRVRSGGVMGFFATERFVAEVEPVEPPTRRWGPAPLADSARRIEAALSRDDDARDDDAWDGGPRAAHRPAGRRPAVRRAPDPVDELAGLLGHDAAEQPEVDVYSRAAFARVATPATAARPAGAPRPAPRTGAHVRPPVTAPRPVADDDAPPPSRFSAALAQMVTGDEEVAAAVDEVMAVSAPATGAGAARSGAARTARGGPAASAGPSLAAALAAVERAAAEQEAARIAAEQEAARIAAEQEAARIAAEQEAARIAAEQEAARIAAERAAAEQEAARIAAEQEAARIAAEQEAARIAAEQEAARIAAEHEAAVGSAEPSTVEFAVPMEATVVPAWLSEPELSGPTTLREEAIAEVLRAALAHDASDDVLTDILRGVLSSASPHGARRGGRPPVPAREPAAEQPAWLDAAVESDDEWEVVADVLSPTASDPAPVPLDATAILPPLSLLPPPSPGAQLAIPPLLSRPPVPPALRRPPVPGRPATGVATSQTPLAPGLATVTRLPIGQRSGTWRSPDPVVVASVRERAAGSELIDPRVVEAAGVVTRLRALGVPEALLGDGFAAEVATSGTYAALTRALAALPTPPAAPTGPGEVLLVVGPGVETLAAARSLAASLRLDGDRLQWASRGDLANLAAQESRIASIDIALERKQEAAQAGELTIVAVDAPLRVSGRTWLEQMLAIWSPTAVWAVVEATRKPEDVGPWLDALPRVDALMVQDADLTADPAAVLSRTAAPVALLDGARATAHRWASLLCERLEAAGA